MQPEFRFFLIEEHSLDTFKFRVVGEMDHDASASTARGVNFNPRSQYASQFLLEGGQLWIAPPRTFGIGG